MQIIKNILHFYSTFHQSISKRFASTKRVNAHNPPGELGQYGYHQPRYQMRRLTEKRISDLLTVT